jgi:ribosomal protein S18 acetylase RimI-like enzyme
VELRPYIAADFPELAQVCAATADNGCDARETFARPDLVARYYLEPYLRFDPGLCLTLADTRGPCGYVVGAADSCAFVRWFNTHWLPDLRAASQAVRVPRGAPDAWFFDLIRNDATVPKAVDRYPAHLHIDLLPRAQGQGWGRRMVETWMALAAARGANGVHVGVGESNKRAVVFYERIGFLRLDGEDGILLGRRIAAAR